MNKEKYQEAIFVITTNLTLAWSGFQSVSHVNILNVSSGTGAWALQIQQRYSKEKMKNSFCPN
jgi:hypothetical protein